MNHMIQLQTASAVTLLDTHKFHCRPLIVSPGATQTGVAPTLSITCNIPHPVTLQTAQYHKVMTYSVTLFHCTLSLAVYALIKTYKTHTYRALILKNLYVFSLS
jgi:hypothetical protein